MSQKTAADSASSRRAMTSPAVSTRRWDVMSESLPSQVPRATWPIPRAAGGPCALRTGISPVPAAPESYKGRGQGSATGRRQTPLESHCPELGAPLGSRKGLGPATFGASPRRLESEVGRTSDHDDSRADPHAIVEVHHVLVQHADATRRDRAADGMRFVGAV